MQVLTVGELAAGLTDVRVLRGGDLPVHRVRVDSRKIERGDLFCALPGREQDGARFAGEALARGAVGVLAAEGVAPLPEGAWLEAARPRRAAALLASRAWGSPSERLDVLGVTGTNGKTTTSYLVRAIWQAAGRKAAVLGTLGVGLPEGWEEQARTTPEAPELQEVLARAAEQGAKIAVMEVSSHALDLHRVDGTTFRAAAFLNLSPEHLDWHGTMEAYARAKMRLFSELLAPGTAVGGPRAVLNGKDPWAARFRDVVEDALVFTTGGGDADVTARGLRAGHEGCAFTISTPVGETEIELALPGEHNVENALAAASLALVQGVGLDAIRDGLARAVGPPGRFERVHAGSFDAYVDYAHTEAGVRHALDAARALACRRVIVVLGCGGDRDPSKRPVLGRLAAELADAAVFTTDNPRGEDPRRILDAMVRGAEGLEDRVEVVPDREEALGRAVELAGAGDLVLALGKGHETVQSIGGVDHPFPEREILTRLAARRDGERA